MKLSVLIDGLTLSGLALIGAGLYKVSPILFVISAGATLLALALALARREANSRTQAGKESN